MRHSYATVLSPTGRYRVPSAVYVRKRNHIAANPTPRRRSGHPVLQRFAFGTLADGRPVDLYVLRSAQVELSVISYGAIVTSVRTPCRRGRMANVVLGYDTVTPYLSDDAYLGAVIGRYANRIAHGRFQLNGATYQLETNDGVHHLHGGTQGFGRQLWCGEPILGTETSGVRFTRISPAGEDAYPGTVSVEITYLLSADGVVTLRYHATTDAPTPLNLTQHSYFNLSGDSDRSILGHELTIHADRYTPVDTTLIPEGHSEPAKGTPFDLRAPRRIGDQLASSHEQLCRGMGFDHNWVLADAAPCVVRSAARLHDPRTGRSLEIATSQPGIQCYTGQRLGNGTAASPGRFPRYAGLCLETQHFPDSPNKPGFPSTVLRPGAEYRSRTVFAFGVV